ncbi:MAG: leucine-rich repeat domain-containing protein [Chitinispirillales bacterium]|jgi:hypothetical protein|nr:leucine-rich repeat domain-containing protein [Chitinispirillales bacterium]
MAAAKRKNVRSSVFLFIIMFVSVTAYTQSLPKIAVYVTGGVGVHKDEKKALGTRILSALVERGHFIAIERSDVFLAEIDKEQAKQRSGAIDDSQISALGKQYGVRYVCAADITPAFGGFQVSARIIDVETAVVAFIGDANSPLKSMDDLEQVSDEVVRKMFKESKPVRPIASNGALQSAYSSSEPPKIVATWDCGAAVGTVAADLLADGTFIVRGNGNMKDNAMYLWSKNKSAITNIVVEDGVMSIGKSAFSGSNNLSALTIPNSVASIGNSAFSNCGRLAAVTCRNPVPPRLELAAFDGVKYMSCVVNVPQNSIDAYRQAAGWKTFKNITAVSMPPKQPF